jgi:hypothetical protein
MEVPASMAIPQFSTHFFGVGRGFVYFIEAASERLYKIGQTGNARKRVSSIQTSSPVPLRLVLLIETDSRRTLEKRYHHRFAMDQVRGEWFELHAEDIYEVREDALRLNLKPGAPDCLVVDLEETDDQDSAALAGRLARSRRLAAMAGVPAYEPLREWSARDILAGDASPPVLRDRAYKMSLARYERYERKLRRLAANER